MDEMPVWCERCTAIGWVTDRDLLDGWTRVQVGLRRHVCCEQCTARAAVAQAKGEEQ